MNDGPELVSVIIPSYDRPHLVQRAVRSVLQQTHTRLEVIVVLDGPDAVTESAFREALKPFQDQRLRCIALPSNQGQAVARSEGIRISTGQWLALLDDDDEWHPEKLERQLQAAHTANSKLVLVASRFCMQDQAHREIWPRRLPADDEPLGDFLFCRRSAFQGDGILLTTTLFFSRALANRVTFGNGRRHEDWLWLLEASCVPGFELVFCPEVLATWHADSNRPRSSQSEAWESCLDWGQSVRSLLSPRAYAGFISSVVASAAGNAKAWDALLPLMRELATCQAARAIDWALLIAMFAVPRQLRRKIRKIWIGTSAE